MSFPDDQIKMFPPLLCVSFIMEIVSTPFLRQFITAGWYRENFVSFLVRKEICLRTHPHSGFSFSL